MISKKIIYHNKPFFSIIIATLNNVDLIGDCLDSIISQTEQDYEILISDGGSLDGTQNVVKLFEDKVSFMVSSKDSGIYDAWNRVLPYVNGKWILFLGSDDRIYNINSLLEAKKNIIKTQKNVKYIVFPLVFRDRNNDNIDMRSKSEIEDSLRSGDMGLPHPSTFHCKTLFEDYGLFDSKYKIVGDLDFALRTWKNGGLTVYDKPVLTVFATHGISNNLESRRLHLTEKMMVLFNHKFYFRSFKHLIKIVVLDISNIWKQCLIMLKNRMKNLDNRTRRSRT